jgi:hypothetical protein
MSGIPDMLAEDMLKEIDRQRAEISRLKEESENKDDLRLWSEEAILEFLERRAKECDRRDLCSCTPTELSYCATRKAVAELKTKLLEHVRLKGELEKVKAEFSAYREMVEEEIEP